MNCPHCSSPIGVADRFCEGCGKALPRETPTALKTTEASRICSCGSVRFDVDYFCLECGKKLEIPVPVTLEIIDDGLASATHPGRTHATNQDAVGVRRFDSGEVLLVVSDGVSTADHAEEAAQLIVKTILEDVSSLVETDPRQALLTAIQKADGFLKTLPYDNHHKAEPEATVVAALVRDRKVWFGWVGDSRIYHLKSTEGRQLSEDDSWLTASLRSGLTREQAIARGNLHCITQSLGMRGEEPEIHLSEAELESNSWLILCSDGLWNYFDEPEVLIGQMPSKGFSGPASELCEHWVNQANIRGGQDNISVAALRMR